MVQRVFLVIRLAQEIFVGLSDYDVRHLHVLFADVAFHLLHYLDLSGVRILVIHVDADCADRELVPLQGAEDSHERVAVVYGLDLVGQLEILLVSLVDYDRRITVGVELVGVDGIHALFIG